MPTAEKAVKERDCTQMPVAKKEQTTNACCKEIPNHKCWWQTKKGCPNQASKQLTPNERKETAETTSKSANGCLKICKHKVRKKQKTKRKKARKKSHQITTV